MTTSQMPVNKSEINSLVKLVGGGDWEAFKQLEDKMYKILYRFLYKYCYNPETVKDVISTTFCIVIEKSKEKMFYSNCFSWIISIAKNQMMNYLKDNKPYVYTDKIEDFGEMDNFITKLSLKQAVNTLNKREQHLIYLLYFEELKQKQVSKLMKISIPTLKRHKKEILHHLKRQVQDEEN